MTKAGNKIKDNSSDRKYFTQVPRIVWALCDTPQMFTLWCVVKQIAGEKGECFISTIDLAEMSMMGKTAVAEYRARLIDVGLIDGELRKDPGYPFPVWRLSVPDLWAKNIDWAQDHRTIAQRLTFKKDQREDLKAEREEERPLNGSTLPAGGLIPPADGYTLPPAGNKEEAIEEPFSNNHKNIGSPKAKSENTENGEATASLASGGVSPSPDAASDANTLAGENGKPLEERSMTPAEHKSLRARIAERYRDFDYDKSEGYRNN